MYANTQSKIKWNEKSKQKHTSTNRHTPFTINVKMENEANLFAHKINIWNKVHRSHMNIEQYTSSFISETTFNLNTPQKMYYWFSFYSNTHLLRDSIILDSYSCYFNDTCLNLECIRRNKNIMKWIGNWVDRHGTHGYQSTLSYWEIFAERMKNLVIVN